jgi:hypothetical protein
VPDAAADALVPDVVDAGAVDAAQMADGQVPDAARDTAPPPVDASADVAADVAADAASNDAGN